METGIKEKIEGILRSESIVLFMKGTSKQPQCGFSAQVVQVLGRHHVEYKAVNILDDWNLRQGIKEYSNWPTIPQFYVDEKFIGGCDIIMELERKGELMEILKRAKN